jgi:uncharacterized membrane protein HdeD (DUF308 family)
MRRFLLRRRDENPPEEEMSTIGASTYTNDPVKAEKRRAISECLARNWWTVALRGLAAVAFGLIAIFLPGVTMLSLVLVFAAYMFVDGVMSLVSATRAGRHHEAWGLLAMSGVASIVAGVIAVAWPGITVLAFVILVAVAQLITGALMLRSAFLVEHDHGRWWLAIGGVLALIFGILLIVAPFIGALVLTWWLGIYATAMGIVLLAFSFKLRSRHVEGLQPGIPPIA